MGLKAIKYIRQQLYIARKVKKPLSQIEVEISQVLKGDLLAICPQPTGNSWQGVLTATEGLFPGNALQLPQYYSHTVYSKKELVEIANMIIHAGVQKVVLSGYLDYFDALVHCFHKNKVEISIIYHGSHTSILEDSNAASSFSKLLMLSKSGSINKIGFVKKDMDKTFSKLTGVSCYPILLKTDENIIGNYRQKLPGINIGVLTHDQFRKNIYNQVSAALLVDDAIVHVKDKYLLDYLGNQDRLFIHGFQQDRKSFLKLLGSMQVNLYVTFSECWGQFVNESLAMGVPCLTSDVSSVLDFDDEMKKRLIVKEFDNDYAISGRIKDVLGDLNYFQKEGPEYIRKLNIIADKVLFDFLK